MRVFSPRGAAGRGGAARQLLHHPRPVEAAPGHPTQRHHQGLPDIRSAEEDGKSFVVGLIRFRC